MIRKISNLFFLLVFLVFTGDLLAQVHVRGYTRKNGTYVAPHIRSSPNSYKYDNYSSEGNYNPYTGKRGAKSADPAYGVGAYQYATPASSYEAIASDYLRAQAISARLRTQQFQIQEKLQLAQQDELTQSIVSGFRNPKSLSPAEIALLTLSLSGMQSQATRPAQFHGDLCTNDCSGHEAGYEWAEENEVTDPDDCSGNSDSFIEGCQAYAEENQ